MSLFLRDRSGGVLPIFGLITVLVFGAVGAAVDYSRASAVRADLQAALDSVALMLSKEAIGLTQSELNKRANVYFAAVFNRGTSKLIRVKPTFETAGNTFRVKVSGSIPVDTSVARVIGVNTITVGGNAEVAWEMRRLELALALDNTGSMAKLNKMAELKKATKSLIATLKDAARSPDHIKVSIIPFDTLVNVGTGNRDASWMRYDAGVDKASWQGCVMDRDQPYDAQDAAPSSALTQFPAAKCTDGSDLRPITSLTNDWSALHAAADAMAPNGTTNVGIGLAWAWHSLTTGAPLTGAAAPKQDLDKVIVLLTDGDNTKNRWSTSASSIDARTKATCNNVKAAGIKIYTIRVIEGNAAMLQDCASSSTMFYNVNDATQLNAVFALIAKNLANIRLSR